MWSPRRSEETVVFAVLMWRRDDGPDDVFANLPARVELHFEPGEGSGARPAGAHRLDGLVQAHDSVLR